MNWAYKSKYSLVLLDDVNMLVQELKSPYNRVNVIVGCTDHSQFKSASSNVKIVDLTEAESESQAWVSLMLRVHTPFVLVGWALKSLYSPWLDLERSIRLLQSRSIIYCSVLQDILQHRWQNIMIILQIPKLVQWLEQLSTWQTIGRQLANKQRFTTTT